MALIKKYHNLRTGMFADSGHGSGGGGGGVVCGICVHIHFNIFVHHTSPRSGVLSGLDWSGFLG